MAAPVSLWEQERERLARERLQEAARDYEANLQRDVEQRTHSFTFDRKGDVRQQRQEYENQLQQHQDEDKRGLDQLPEREKTGLAARLDQEIQQLRQDDMKWAADTYQDGNTRLRLRPEELAASEDQSDRTQSRLARAYEDEKQKQITAFQARRGDLETGIHHERHEALTDHYQHEKERLIAADQAERLLQMRRGRSHERNRGEVEF